MDKLKVLKHELKKLDLEKFKKRDRDQQITALLFMVDSAILLYEKCSSPMKKSVAGIVEYVKNWEKIKKLKDSFDNLISLISEPDLAELHSLEFPAVENRDAEFTHELDAAIALKQDIEYSKYANAVELLTDIKKVKHYDRMVEIFGPAEPRTWIFRRAGFYSYESYRPINEVFDAKDLETAAKKLKKNLVILIWNVNEPIVYNVEKIINPKVAEKYYSQGNCLSKKAVERFQLIDHLADSSCKLPEYKFTTDVVMVDESYKYMVVESLNCNTYRILSRSGKNEFDTNPFAGHDNILESFNEVLGNLIISYQTKSVVTSSFVAKSKHVLVQEIAEYMLSKFKKHYLESEEPRNVNDIRNLISWNENVSVFIEALTKNYASTAPSSSDIYKKELFAFYYSKLNDLLGKLNKEIYQKTQEIKVFPAKVKEFVYDEYYAIIKKVVMYILSNDNNINDEMLKKGEIMRILVK